MRISYFNINHNNSRDQITISGLRENGVEVLEFTDQSRGLRKFWHLARKYRSEGRQTDLIMIGHTGAILVPWLWLISGQKIIYNSVASFYESMIISREVASSFSLRSLKYWLIDWLAFKLASRVIVESELQKKFIAKTFFLNSKKIIVNFTGVDESKFFFDEKIKKLEQFTVVFRGKFLPEAGVDIIIHTAKKLERENINFRIIGHGLLEKEIGKLVEKLKPTNLELITEKLPTEILRQKMQECHLSLGQMARHPRLERTIPHKAFESLAMKLPYLTGRQPAILELLEEDKTCFCCESGDAQDLSGKILILKNERDRLESVAQSAFDFYRENLRARLLGEKILVKLKEKELTAQ